MARYSSPGEPSTCDDEVIYVQRPLPPYDDGFRRRLWGLLTVVLIGLCLLLGRTWQLQVLQGEYFLHLSEQNTACGVCVRRVCAARSWIVTGMCWRITVQHTR